jgi:hypothetical protein
MLSQVVSSNRRCRGRAVSRAIRCPSASPPTRNSEADELAELSVRPLLPDPVNHQVDLLVVEANQPGDALAFFQGRRIPPDQVHHNAASRRGVPMRQGRPPFDDRP